jgi:hypothetical protein
MTKKEILELVYKDDLYWDLILHAEDQDDYKKVAMFCLQKFLEAGMLPPPHNVDILTREPHPRGEMILYDWEKKVD